MNRARARFAVQRVWKELDPDSIYDGKLLATGWVDDEDTPIPGVPIADRIAHNFWVGVRSDPTWMEHAWVEGTEKGLKVVEVDMGEAETASWSFTGTLKVKAPSHKWHADEDFMILRAHASVGVGTGPATFQVYKNGSSICTLVIPSGKDHVRSDPLFVKLHETEYLQVGVTSPGSGTKDATVEVVLRKKVLKENAS